MRNPMPLFPEITLSDAKARRERFAVRRALPRAAR
jgi:hypothetical protein